MNFGPLSASAVVAAAVVVVVVVVVSLCLSGSELWLDCSSLNKMKPNCS